MITVTHDIDEAIIMADRIFLMKQNPGQIVDELKADLPWPRNQGDSAFQVLRNELMERFTSI